MTQLSLEQLEHFALRNGLCTGGEWEDPEEQESYLSGLQLARKRLPRILEGVLTPRQREYITLYFFEGKSIPCIARELQVNKSSVQRAAGERVLPVFCSMRKKLILVLRGHRFAQALLHKMRFPVHNRDSRQETKPRAHPQTAGQCV